MTEYDGAMRGNGGRTKFLCVMLGLFALVDGLMFVSRIFTLRMLSGISAGNGLDYTQAAADDRRTQILAIIYLLLLFGTMLIYCLWLHRASKNAHALSGGALVASPGWAVGWHFVPFANLVKPFQSMVEIWKVSGNPHDPESILYPEWLLRSWWALWLICNFASNISFRFSDPQHLDLFMFSLWLDMLSSLCAIGASVLLMQIVRRIQAMQGDARMVAEVFA